MGCHALVLSFTIPHVMDNTLMLPLWRRCGCLVCWRHHHQPLSFLGGGISPQQWRYWWYNGCTWFIRGGWGTSMDNHKQMCITNIASAVLLHPLPLPLVVSLCCRYLGGFLRDDDDKVTNERAGNSLDKDTIITHKIDRSEREWPKRGMGGLLLCFRILSIDNYLLFMGGCKNCRLSGRYDWGHTTNNNVDMDRGGVCHTGARLFPLNEV